MPIEQQLSEILSELKAIHGLLSPQRDEQIKGISTTHPLMLEWEKFYKEVFGMDVDLLDVEIPKNPSDFNWVVFIAKDLTLNKVWTKCKERFPCWSYYVDLDSKVTKNDRTPKTTYAVRFRDRVEADEENKNLSANTLAKRETQNITLLERILLELQHHWRTGQHLDVKNVTLCAGSRCSVGYVPSALWIVGRFEVDYSYPGLTRDNLRSRTAL